MSEHGKIVTDDGISLAWRTDGNRMAQPLLLANSLGTTMEMWEPQLAEWSLSHHIIRYDMCGHGASSVRRSGFGIDRLGQDALTILDHFGIKQTAFVGVSLGGMIGQWLGFAAPDRIARLVLANTSAHMPPPEAWNMRIATVRNQGLSAIVPAVIERWFTPSFRATSPLPGALAAIMAAGSPEGYTAACAAIRDMDFRENVAAISAPTLVIGGKADPATPPPHSQQLSKAIPRSALRWLKAAHLSNLEQPTAFADAVADFLMRPEPRY